VAEFHNLKSEVAERGYSILPQAVSPGAIDNLEKNLSETPLPRSRAGMRHALRHPAVLEAAHSAELLGVAREVLGSEAFPFKATLFDKSPASNWLVVWHQDTALPLRERRETPEWGPWSVKEGVIYAHAPASVLSRVVALRLHLDDSNATNGPLRVLPGTHTLGVLTDHEVHDCAERIIPADCLVARGGLLVMKPLILHASSKSRSEASRRVLHIEYAPAIQLEHGLELAIS
jgi:ectoine hydroxylase-related dioxygenase (phytanoyl-CoA dioxygenase family)